MKIAFPERAELPPPDEIRAIVAALALLARERTQARDAVPAWRMAARNPELSYDELRALVRR
ncbi:MAG: hypothetical protein ACLQPV_03025 [Vulcanimicrobiaceae bacterium]